MVDLGPIGGENDTVREEDFETILASYLGMLDPRSADKVLLL